MFLPFKSDIAENAIGATIKLATKIMLKNIDAKIPKTFKIFLPLDIKIPPFFQFTLLYYSQQKNASDINLNHDIFLLKKPFICVIIIKNVLVIL